MSNDQEDLGALFEEVYKKNHGGPRQDIQEKPTGEDGSLDNLFESVFEKKHGESLKSSAPTMTSEEGDRSENTLPHRSVHLGVGEDRFSISVSPASYVSEQDLHHHASRMFSEIPGMQERLTYITKIADDAASLVIELAEAAMPKVDGILADCRELDSAWNQVFAGRISVAEFRNVATQTSRYFQASQEVSQQVKSLLVKVIMAQGFQDLTGQVVQKIKNTLGEVREGLGEAGVVGLEHLPREILEGPRVIDRVDSVSNQSEVDDLLNSLGF
jgi:chemotaxis protein CheZ